MSIPCPQCGATMPDEAAFCPGCGCRMMVVAPIVSGSLNDNLLAALAYITFVPAIFFLLREPFKSNPFIRFHAMQSVFLSVSAVMVGIGLKILSYVLGLIPWLGHLLVLLTALVVSIGWVILWLVAMIKALQGERFHVPLIGGLAESA
jgi:uncharacterized membrane protein